MTPCAIGGRKTSGTEKRSARLIFKKLERVIAALRQQLADAR
jgi:hypothetical protein